MAMDFSELETSKAYCFGCFRDGIVTELSNSILGDRYEACEDHNTRFKFRIDYHKDEFKVFRGLAFNTKPQSDVCRLGIETQKENKTGWFSEDSIKRRNASDHQRTRQINAAVNGNKLQGVLTQIARGLHPSQNIELQARKAILMQLRKMGINKSLEEISVEKFYSAIEALDIKLEKIPARYEDSKQYNNRCGALGLTGVFKEDKIRYALNAGKSVDLGSEIRMFWRILSNPQKQLLEDDFGRWHDITNNYTDFEIDILIVDVSEKEALMAEAFWAVANKAVFKSVLENESRIKTPGSHGYWM